MAGKKVVVSAAMIDEIYAVVGVAIREGKKQPGIDELVKALIERERMPLQGEGVVPRLVMGQGKYGLDEPSRHTVHIHGLSLQCDGTGCLEMTFPL